MIVRTFSLGEIVAFASETGGAYSLVKMDIRPGGGPPPHTHLKEDEGFFVLQGRFEIFVGKDKPITLGTWGHAFGPRCVQHYFRNVGHEWGQILLTLTPGGLEKYFQELDQARADPGLNLLELETAIDQRYGIVGIDRYAKKID